MTTVITDPHVPQEYQKGLSESGQMQEARLKVIDQLYEQQQYMYENLSINENGMA